MHGEALHVWRSEGLPLLGPNWQTQFVVLKGMQLK